MKSRLLKRGESGDRADDNEETIKSRLAVFEEQTIPVIEHYEQEEKVKKVRAKQKVLDALKVLIPLFLHETGIISI